MARILVIDDEESIRILLRKILEQAGHEVIEAVDGEKGTDIFYQTPTDLIVTDILMPEKEGLRTIMDIRRDFPEVKIIAISGGGTVEPETYLNLAEKLGADRTLTKPFRTNELLVMVAELL
ncbi:MAG: response regulator [Thermodesulfobacteriota bacterium]|nr:response regulator [Thermodesulfobacteriota bacterium]